MRFHFIGKTFFSPKTRQNQSLDISNASGLGNTKLMLSDTQVRSPICLGHHISLM